MMRYTVFNAYTDEDVANVESLQLAYKIRDMLEGKFHVWDNEDSEQVG